MAGKIATPRYCIQHRRFSKQNGWRLWDLSLSLNGNIAVTGSNEKTHRTSIDVYTNVRHSDSRDKPKMIYSKEFEKYSDEKRIYINRRVSFIDDDVLVSCLGNKLEVFQVKKGKVLRSRKLNGDGKCLSVRERREIFIGFRELITITLYDVMELNEIKSIILQGIQDGYWPYDMTVIADRIFVCVGEAKEGSERKSLICEEKNGRILSELTKPTDTVQWYVSSVGVNMNTLGIASLVWRDAYYYKEGEHNSVVFYSLLSENNCSFLIVMVECGVRRIRISDRGDRMITGNIMSGEVKVYDMAEVFTYSHFKEKLVSTLEADECTELANFFKIPKDQLDAIVGSDTPSNNLFFALEEKGILQPYNVERLIRAFEELTINPFCRHMTEVFLKTRPSAFYIERIEKLEEKISKVKKESEEETRQLKEKTTEVEDLREELKKLQKAHMKTAQELEKFKAKLDEGELQLSSLQNELKASKKAKAETEKVFKQPADLPQKIIPEKNENKTVPKQLQEEEEEESLGPMSAEEGRKEEAKSGTKTLRGATSGEDSSPSRGKSKHSAQSVQPVPQDEFSKFIVRVSRRLTRTNCVYLARYFNLEPAKIATIQDDSKAPGLDLFDALIERSIINMHDVTKFQRALVELQLEEINETLVSPYHKKI